MPRGVQSGGFVDRSGATGTASVALEFCGIFGSGPRKGQLFGGAIHYPAGVPASETHANHAQFDQWPAPIMTVMVSGQQVTAESASIYAGIPDGHGAAIDLVTLSGLHDALEPAKNVEVMFASAASGCLDPSRMPTAAELVDMKIKRLHFAAAGEASSTGDLLFGSVN